MTLGSRLFHAHAHKHMCRCTHTSAYMYTRVLAEPKQKALCSQPKYPFPTPYCSRISKGSGSPEGRASACCQDCSPRGKVSQLESVYRNSGNGPSSSHKWHKGGKHRSRGLLSTEATPPHGEGQSSNRSSCRPPTGRRNGCCVGDCVTEELD